MNGVGGHWSENDTTVADGLLTSGCNTITSITWASVGILGEYHVPPHSTGFTFMKNILLYHITHTLTRSVEKWHSILCNVTAYNGLHCAEVRRRNNYKGMWTDTLTVLGPSTVWVTVKKWDVFLCVSVCSFQQGSDPQPYYHLQHGHHNWPRGDYPLYFIIQAFPDECMTQSVV